MALLTGCTADATQFMLLIESNLEVETELTKVQLTVNWQNEPGQSPSTLVEEIRMFLKGRVFSSYSGILRSRVPYLPADSRRQRVLPWIWSISTVLR